MTTAKGKEKMALRPLSQADGLDHYDRNVEARH